MITADKVFKGSTEIIRIYKGTTLEWEKSVPIPDADAYIQDGLVFQLDGIDKGNDAWIDRKGQKEFVLHNVVTNSNNMEFNGTNSYAACSSTLGYDSATHTLEVVWEGNKVTGVPFFGGPTSAELCLLPQGTPIRRLSFGTGMNFIVNQPDELKMISANADNIIYNAGWIGTSAALEANASYNQTVASVGRYETSNYFRGKIYAIRVYDRKLTTLEMLQNQLIDIQRFGLDSHFETINLTITGNTDMTGCRFMLNRQEYEYTGKTMTFKVREGQAYQLTYDSFPEHTAPSNPEPVVAEGGKVRNITAEYVDNGWGDYLVLDTTKDGITNGAFTNATIEGDYEEIDDTTIRYKVKCNAGWKFNSAAMYLKSIKAVKQWPSNKPTNIYLELSTASAITYIAPLITNVNTAVLGPTKEVENNITNLGGTVQLNGLPDTTKGYQTLNNNIVLNNTSNYVNRYFHNTTHNVGYAVGTHKYGRVKYSNVDGDTKIGKYYFLLANFLASDTDIRINPSNNTISEWKYIEFVDLFRNLGMWNYDLTRLNNWGTGGEENRMSVVNSLITNNIDRTKFEASGTATITLSATTKALLTAEEISQIEAMGYTLA